MHRDVEDLSNDDVQWHGTAEGLHAAWATDRARRLAAMNPEAIVPELITALSDAEKFAAAHALLTSLTGVQYTAFPSWNGLRVDIGVDGHATIDPAQRHGLARRWQHWRDTIPRPSALAAE